MHLISRNIPHCNWILSGYIIDLQRNEILMLEYKHKESECGREFQGGGSLP